MVMKRTELNRQIIARRKYEKSYVVTCITDVSMICLLSYLCCVVQSDNVKRPNMRKSFFDMLYKLLLS